MYIYTFQKIRKITNYKTHKYGAVLKLVLGRLVKNGRNDTVFLQYFSCLSLSVCFSPVSIPISSARKPERELFHEDLSRFSINGVLHSTFPHDFPLPLPLPRRFFPTIHHPNLAGKPHSRPPIASFRRWFLVLRQLEIIRRDQQRRVLVNHSCQVRRLREGLRNRQPIPFRLGRRFQWLVVVR